MKSITVHEPGMTVFDAKRALRFVTHEKIALRMLVEIVRRSRKNMEGVVRIFLRGCGATDSNLDLAVQAFYVLAQNSEAE